MIELPNWVATAVGVFFYVFVVPGLAAYAILCVALLVSPALSAIFGGVPLRARYFRTAAFSSGVKCSSFAGPSGAVRVLANQMFLLHLAVWVETNSFVFETGPL